MPTEQLCALKLNKNAKRPAAKQMRATSVKVALENLVKMRYATKPRMQMKSVRSPTMVIEDLLSSPSVPLRLRSV